MDDPAPTLPECAAAYHVRGWPVLELPYHTKGPPPEGRTGREGVDMTADEVAAARWTGNIGLRMPADVIGLDVDAYRGGLDSLNELVKRLGALPRTWISHNGRDDGSGIRFYRVPADLVWVTTLPGIDIIQRGHRYAAVWPSTHPDGRTYNWWDQSITGPSEVVPVVEDLPDLPWEWQQELSRADTSTTSRAVGAQELGDFIDGHDERADSPSYIESVIAPHFTERVAAGYSRHDTMQHVLTWSMECVRAGVAAAKPTIQLLADLWTDVMAAEPRRAQLWSDRRITEFDAMIRHAVGKVVVKPQAEMDKMHDDIAGINVASTAVVALSSVQPPAGDVIDVYQAPTICIDWPTFSQRDATPHTWMVEDFWPDGRAMALYGPAKEGKTVIAHWCAAKLALGEHPWTGDPRPPVNVLYLDYEMTADDLEDRLDEFGIDPLRLDHLHYALLPPIHGLDTPEGGAEVVALVEQVGARAVVIDTFTRAVIGNENEADTVRAFYRHTGARLKSLGIAWLRIDHTGKDPTRGQRGTSAKRDDVDVVWSVRRTNTGFTLNCQNNSRLSWVGPGFDIDRVTHVGGTISLSAPMRMGWGPGVAGKAQELDSLSLPLDISRPKAREALTAAGISPGRNTTLSEALKYRREVAGRSPAGAVTEAPDDGDRLGDSLFSEDRGQ